MNPQSLVDQLDYKLYIWAQKALTDTTGTYHPSGLYTRSGTVKPKTYDMVSAIRTIRSAQREVNAKAALEAQDESLTPQQEAVIHYTAIYKRLSLRASEPWRASNDSDSNSRLQLQAHMDNVPNSGRDHQGLPERKSPGLDGIDKRVLMLPEKGPSLHAELNKAVQPLSEDRCHP